MNNKDTINYFVKITECIDYFTKSYFPTIGGFSDKIKEDINTGIYDNIFEDISNKYNKKYNNINSKFSMMAFQFIIDKLHENIRKKVEIKKEHVEELEECNICMDNLSNVKTSCNHMLCLQCCNKLKYSCSNDNVKCPFCRQIITSFTILDK